MWVLLVFVFRTIEFGFILCPCTMQSLVDKTVPSMGMGSARRECSQSNQILVEYFIELCVTINLVYLAGRIPLYSKGFIGDLLLTLLFW